MPIAPDLSSRPLRLTVERTMAAPPPEEALQGLD